MCVCVWPWCMTPCVCPPPQCVACSETMVAVGLTHTQAITLLDYSSGDILRSIGLKGESIDRIYSPVGVRFSPDARYLAVADAYGNRAAVFNIAGSCVGSFAVGGTPVDIEYNENGELLVLQESNLHVLASDASARVAPTMTVALDREDHPSALCVRNGRLYTADAYNNSVHVFVSPTAVM